MTTQLRPSQIHEYFLPGSINDPRLLHAGKEDLILSCPAKLGQGYRQEISLREDLTLVIIDYTFNQMMLVDTVGTGDRIEFEFHLAGTHAGYSLCIPCFKLRQFGVRLPKKRVFKVEIFFKGSALVEYAQLFLERLSPQARTAAERILHTVYAYQANSSSNSSLQSTRTTARLLSQVFSSSLSQQASKQVSGQVSGQGTQACFKSSVTAQKQYTSLNPSMEQILSETLHADAFSLNYATYSPITIEMRAILENILSCPYRGSTRLSYLEKQALHLVDLRLNALVSTPGKDDDIDCIHRAANLLRKHMLAPPSLEVLARQVGTNRLKLNQGFRTLYGTTVFGYLRSYRLSQAKRLLITSDLSIDQVSQSVGYASRSRFATAFRQRIGINPKAFQLYLEQSYG